MAFTGFEKTGGGSFFGSGSSGGSNVSMLFGRIVPNNGSTSSVPFSQSNNSQPPPQNNSEPTNGNKVTMVFGKPVSLANPGSFNDPTPLFGNKNASNSKLPFSRPNYHQTQESQPTQRNNAQMIFGKSTLSPTSASNFRGQTQVFGSKNTNTNPSSSTVPFGQPNNSQPPPKRTNGGTRPVFGTAKPNASIVQSSPFTTRQRPQSINGGPRPVVGARNPNPYTPNMPIAQSKNVGPRSAFGRTNPTNTGASISPPSHSKNLGPRSAFGRTNPTNKAVLISPPIQRRELNLQSPTETIYQNGPRRNRSPPYQSSTELNYQNAPGRNKSPPHQSPAESNYQNAPERNRSPPSYQSPTVSNYQNAARRNKSPPSYQDLDAPTNFHEADNNRRLVNYADTLLDDNVNNFEPIKRIRSPYNQIQRSGAQLEIEEFDQIAPNRNRSPVHSRLTFPDKNIENAGISNSNFESAGNAYPEFENAGTSGPPKSMRSPSNVYQRSDAQLETEELDEIAPNRNQSPVHSRLTFPNKNIENPNFENAGISNSNFENAGNANPEFHNAGTSGPPKCMRYPSNVYRRDNTAPKAESSYQNAPKRNLSPVPNQDFGVSNAKRQVAFRDLSDENFTDSSKRIRSPNLANLRHEDQSQTEGFYQNAPDRNKSPASQSTSGRRQVAYNDSLFDDISDEPTKATQFVPHQIQRQNASPTRQGFKRTISPIKDDNANNKSKKLISLNASNNSNSLSPQLFAETEREDEAKARRLARFGPELSQQVEAPAGETSKPDEANKQTDIEFSDATAIVGVCPDMCPETERDERGRKGDLDKHERLNGDRNQTTKLLAVKKYTRTAERDAYLIRPLPVLMKTMEYLLQLLDMPYGDNFLGLYNFLWDRMRAIRMDLRMQHIFNRDAIFMLEQMIRLHIIAMHELCEYNKGEGFSEGFDAHLNIEQMNKASVDLFQMYDDHRRKGINIPTEKEFRGYYALLKLDKHPGYKVEPAELSLDLAKMSLEVRRSPEISFARDVSKACRMGNYMSFFRLAKKASFLQGCLMHAHFFKLRTQALASLHNGFQNNQGMPISQLEGWLAMKGEDIETFVQSHGFVLKQFEEMYIVKEGPFVRPEGDPPNNRSPLVDAKKSETIKLDVYAPPENNIVSPQVPEVTKLTGTKRVVPEPEVNVPIKATDSPRPVKIANLTQVEVQPVVQPEVAEPEVKVPEFEIPVKEPEFQSPVIQVAKRTKPAEFVAQPVVEPDVRVEHVSFIGTSTRSESLLEISSGRDVVVVPEQDKEEVSKEKVMVVLPVQKKKEFSKDKLKVMLRKWKHITTEKKKAREIRLRKERRQALTHAALEYLSVGPILRIDYNEPMQVRKPLNIEGAIRARFKRQEKSWSLLNVSDLVTPILTERNPDARCLCWKLFLSLPPTDSLSSKWLVKKFGLEREKNSLVSVSEKWSGSQLSLSFVRADNTGYFDNDAISGASCVVFLVQDNISLEMQQARLHNIVNQIPAGSNLPLLVAIGDSSLIREKEESEIIEKLAICNMDRTRIKGVSVIFLKGDEMNQNVFFDDARLRKGVRWLAEESPLQTEVISVNTLDLFRAYLKPKYEDLYDSSQVGPDHCISVFNETLDRISGEIMRSANSNPNFWPCPEVEILGKDTSERNYAEMTLPKPAWSRVDKIEFQISAINGCKLPGFGFDLSWLNQGSYFTDKQQIQDKKKALEDCLITYLTQLTQTVSLTEAREEIRVLVQKHCSLVLNDSYLYIVPKWAAIYRQIFHLRLRKLEEKESSLVYIRDQNAILEYFNYTPKGPQIRTPEVPLDEMIERCCFMPSNSLYDDVANRGHDDVAHQVHETDKEESMNQEHEVYERVEPEVGDDVAQRVYERMESRVSDDVAHRVRPVSDIVGPLFSVQRDSRFLLLLEKCEELQEKNKEILSFYF